MIHCFQGAGMAYRETETMRQRKAEARQRIVDRTWECVAEGGFRNARITRIAGLAGVATGTNYRHLESKEALIAEPVDPKVEEERLIYRKAYADLFEQAIRDGIGEGSIPEQNTRLTATCLVGAISEALVGPLAPTQATETSGHDNNDNDNELVDTIVCFGLRGLTGTRS